MTARRWLYRGTVTHRRLAPVHHAFRYPALFICFPLHEKKALASRLFSLDRFNLFGFHEADHGDGADALAWIRGLLAAEGMDHADGEVHLLTLPRILGFVFNPVSFWLCHDSRGGLRAVLCEVSNTFGERHCYLLQAVDGGNIGDDTELSARKVFHVSPFFDVKGSYRFRFRQSSAQRQVDIDYFEDDRPVLCTSISGRAQALDDRALLRTFFSQGWATVMVVLRIHWQALRLWLKGVRFFRKPAPPIKEITR